MAGAKDQVGARLESRSVLLLGTSNILFTESGEEGRSVNLLREALTKLRPDIVWATHGQMSSPSAEMAARVRQAVETHRPDLIFFEASAHSIHHEYVLWSVQEKYAWLYPAARYIDKGLFRLAGGPHDRDDTPRRWVYKVPRGIASRVFGKSNKRGAEESLRHLTATLDYLLSLEEIFVYLRLSSSSMNPKQRARTEYEEQEKRFWDGVHAYAERRHIPQIRNSDIHKAYGITTRPLGPDGLHSSREYRELQAQYLALKALEALHLEAPESATVVS